MISQPLIGKPVRFSYLKIIMHKLNHSDPLKTVIKKVVKLRNKGSKVLLSTNQNFHITMFVSTSERESTAFKKPDSLPLHLRELNSFMEQ